MKEMFLLYGNKKNSFFLLFFLLMHERCS